MKYRFKGALVAGAALALMSRGAYAVPSFARQTGLPCAVCHDVPPQLTQFGRTFKLDGYVMTTLPQVAQGKDLSINRVPPLSAMVQISATTLTHEKFGTAQAGTVQNTNVEFPQQLSLFYAGEITPHMGAFMQFTYTNGQGAFNMDNTDIRYARESMVGSVPVTWGIDMNNNPTVEDLWNTTPAWAFPWGHSNLADHPFSAYTPMIDENTALGVAGLGEYSMWNGAWYEDFSVYRTSQIAGPQINPQTQGGAISGVAPYWRLSWNHNFDGSSWEIGTFGMHAAFNGGEYGYGAVGVDDKYTDYAVDTQFDHHFGNDLLTLYGTYIREDQDLASTALVIPGMKQHNHLNALHLTGTYQFGLHYQVATAYFNTSGTTNPLYYDAVNQVTTNGDPASAGFIGRVTYLPWENTQFTLQYTGYTKFDGTSTNAGKSNSLYLLAWYLW